MKKLLLAAMLIATPSFAQTPAERYAGLCAGCHTPDPSALRASAFVTNGSAADIAAVIRSGRPARGMPAFGAALAPPDALALAGWLKASATKTAAPTMIGRRIEAENLRTDRSAGYNITEVQGRRYLQWIDRGSHLCYDDLDLTGVRSLEYRYAKGNGEPPRRFAVVAFQGDFGSGRRFPLGEKNTPLTGGWDTFKDERIGLARELSGTYRLCIIGMGGGGVFNLDSFVLSDEAGTNDGITLDLEVGTGAMTAGGHTFRLEKVAEIDGEFWSVEFLDSRTLLATQKTGVLWQFRDGKGIAITGTPAVHLLGQGGLLAVRKHPDYARNGWIYLTYTDALGGKGPEGMLRIVRGKIRDGRWTEQQTIYQAPDRLYTDHGEHFAGRITFAGDYLYFSLGDRGVQENAQALRNPKGKIHRVFHDGRVPPDNPFVDTPGAVPTIWSYGHRNPQGLYYDSRTRALWSTEHGPKGGDELNFIQPGRNYGWPRATHGINYDGTTVSTHTELPGMESPRAHWSPSPGMSNLTTYDGKAFPKWRNHLLVATLAYQQLKLMRLDGNRVVGEDVLMDSLGRIRDVIVGPDGRPYVALNQPNGRIYRLAPAR
jgi:glucose/arabinose dehydrogenase